jgi:hypothetical protein
MSTPATQPRFEDVLGKINGAADKAVAAAPVALPEPFTPFPVEQCPPVVAAFLEQGEAAFQADKAFFVGPLFTALGAAIGNSRTALLKAGFPAPPLLWCVTVGTTGATKSPTMRASHAPTWKRQYAAQQMFEEEMAAYGEAKAEWDAKKKQDREGEPEPKPPVLKNYIISDSTTEAIAVRLMQNRRGLLCAVDEVAGLLKSFNQYKRGGGDKESWLSFYDAGPVKIDRKTGLVGTIIVPNAFVALCGGIQPGVLAGVLADEDFDSGFAGRFLFVMPPVQKKRWSEDVIDAATSDAVGEAFEGLYAMGMDTNEDGRPEPTVMPLMPDAKRAWGEWFDEIEDEMAAADDDESPYMCCLPKLRTAAARLAVILQLVSHVSGERHGAFDETNICGLTMRRAVAIARWFKHEQRRVYAALSMGKGKRRLAKLVSTIAGRGGKVSVRDWQHDRSITTREPPKPSCNRSSTGALASGSMCKIPTAGAPARRWF